MPSLLSVAKAHATAAIVRRELDRYNENSQPPIARPGAQRQHTSGECDDRRRERMSIVWGTSVDPTRCYQIANRTPGNLELDQHADAVAAGAIAARALGTKCP
jgi:hypothetical protein